MVAESRTRSSVRGEPLKVVWQIDVLDDPEFRREQLNAIRKFLLAVRRARGDGSCSDRSVGAAPSIPTVDGGQELDRLADLLGPLQQQVIAAMWSGDQPQPVGKLLDTLNTRRSRRIGYTTLQTTMVRLVRKGILVRHRAGRCHVYDVAAPDAAGLAVRWVLNRFGRIAALRFLEQVKQDPQFKDMLDGTRG